MVLTDSYYPIHSEERILNDVEASASMSVALCVNQMDRNGLRCGRALAAITQLELTANSGSGPDLLSWKINWTKGWRRPGPKWTQWRQSEPCLWLQLNFYSVLFNPFYLKQRFFFFPRKWVLPNPKLFVVRSPRILFFLCWLVNHTRRLWPRLHDIFPNLEPSGPCTLTAITPSYPCQANRWQTWTCHRFNKQPWTINLKNMDLHLPQRRLKTVLFAFKQQRMWRHFAPLVFVLLSYCSVFRCFRVNGQPVGGSCANGAICAASLCVLLMWEMEQKKRWYEKYFKKKKKFSKSF